MKMTNYMEEAFAPATAKYKAQVFEATWGHLAPEKHRAYPGSVTFAVGCYGNDPLNPVALDCVFDGLDDSPWFFDALEELLRAIQAEEGRVCRFEGTFKNYRFKGHVRQVYPACFGVSPRKVNHVCCSAEARTP